MLRKLCIFPDQYRCKKKSYSFAAVYENLFYRKKLCKTWIRTQVLWTALKWATVKPIGCTKNCCFNKMFSSFQSWLELFRILKLSVKMVGSSSTDRLIRQLLFLSKQIGKRTISSSLQLLQAVVEGQSRPSDIDLRK